MSGAESVFNIPPTSIVLGAKLANGSPGVTVFQADLHVGQHTTKVCSYSCSVLSHGAEPIMCTTGGSQKATDKCCSSHR